MGEGVKGGRKGKLPKVSHTKQWFLGFLSFLTCFCIHGEIISEERGNGEDSCAMSPVS